MGGLVDCFTYPLACCHRAAVTTRHVFSSLADQTRSLRLKVQKSDSPSRGDAPAGSFAHRSEVEASLPMKLITDSLVPNAKVKG